MMEIKLRTLTPLWTGGIEGQCDRVHETGIIGSLRWWYEAVVRGLGGWACDQEYDKCELTGEPLKRYKAARERGVDWWDALDEAKASDNPDEHGICDACKVFGTTGWRRRFRVDVQAEGAPAWTGRGLNIKPQARNRGWYLNPGLLGQINLRVSGEPEAVAQIVALVHFLAQWGSIGAKPQLGYGFFGIDSIREGERELKDASLEEIAQVVGKGEWRGWQQLGERDLTENGSMADLRTFTFFKLQFTPRDANWWTQVDGIRQLRTVRRYWRTVNELAEQEMLPVTPALKNALRFGERWSSVAVPQWLFGVIRGGTDRQRGKVGLSWAFRPNQDDGTWEIRGWAYLPADRMGQRAHAEIGRRMDAVLTQPQGWFRALDIGVMPAQVKLVHVKTLTVSEWLNGAYMEEG